MIIVYFALLCINKSDRCVLEPPYRSLGRKKSDPKLREVDGITELNKKPYINHVGLLYLAQGRIKRKTTHMLPISDAEKGDFYFVCHIETVDGQEYNGHGNGNARNIKGVAKDRPFEMAEVRAQNRALRSMLAIGGTTAEEIPEGAELGDEPPERVPSEWTELERKRFGAAISDYGLSMDVVVFMCSEMIKDGAGTPPHPRLMTEEERQRVLSFISGLTQHIKDGWVKDFKRDVGGAP